MSLDTIASIGGAVVAVAGLVASQLLVARDARARRRAEEWIQRRRTLDNALDIYSQKWGEIVENTGKLPSEESLGTGTIALSEGDQELIHGLRARLDAIEERLPDVSTVDKIASVNEAVLATKLEALERDLARVQSAQLSRWDVALVVFAILGAFSVVMGLIAGAVKLLG